MPNYGLQLLVQQGESEESTVTQDAPLTRVEYALLWWG
jgi:hypothetical protein